MAKKKKNQEVLPEGMSRRQAKLAARAAERAKLQKDPRPYAGYAMEADLIAMQEFVPAAHVTVETAAVGDAPATTVHLSTVLPGAVAAMRRAEAEGGDAFVALQSQRRGDNPNRDLARALAWVATAEPGQSLEVGIADGSEPALADILAPATEAEIHVEQDFNYWLTENQRQNPQVAATLKQANDSVLPSYRIDAEIPGAAWWINPGERAHIRWVRLEEEGPLLDALARVHAAGELNLGEGSKFAGVFRTHGVLVPVWDLDNSQESGHWAAGLEALESKIAAALAKGAEADAALTADEQKAKQTIISREVTLR